MKSFFTLIFISIYMLSAAQTAREVAGFQLVWEDNFDSLNTEIWHVQNNFDHYGGERQVYTSRPENVFIQDGNLVLRVNRENYSCPPEALNPWGCALQYNTGQPYEYTSGWIETQPAYNTQFGYAEARIYLPYGRGFWPAFWTFVGEGLPNNTNAAEIDIFEMYGHQPAYIQETNIHLEYCNENYPTYPDCSGIPSYHREHIIPNYAFKYLIYSVEWTPEYIKWKTNDQVIRVSPNPGVVDPVRLIINMAILMGDPPNQATIFPADIKIDYVRVYSDITTATNNNTVSPNEFTVYPNPANQGVVEIKSENNHIIQSITLINALGQIISTENVNAPNHQLDVSNVTKANYFVKIQTDKGEFSTSFVKM
jgi:beta-glucanase (GH16 family)